MPSCDKLLKRARKSQNNLRFEDLRSLAECYGFVFDRQEGSHCIYKRPGWIGILNFQNHKGKAIGYQVRQLLSAIDDILAEAPRSEE